MVGTPPTFYLASFQSFNTSLSHSYYAFGGICAYTMIGLPVIELNHDFLLCQSKESSPPSPSFQRKALSWKALK